MLNLFRKPAATAAIVKRLDVTCNPDGSITVTADSETMARIGGREVFGDPRPSRALLIDRIADAWYAAGCPREV